MWPPLGITTRLPLGLPGLNTAIILLSSAALVTGLRRLRTGRATTFPRFYGLAIGLGLVFLSLQCVVWTRLWQGGFHHDTGAYGGLFYLLTGFHALHVVVGLGLLAWIAI